MPRSGTATYTTGVGGTMVADGVPYSLAGPSSASFTANFASSSVSTTLHFAGAQLGGGASADFGQFTGSGTITSGSPGFIGTLTGTGATGEFSGSFFGPKAAEMAFGWALSGPNLSGAGIAVGTKN
jgi:hypothetical protein